MTPKLGDTYLRGPEGQKRNTPIMSTYFTVIIPYTREGATRWHPTTSTGPFSTLSRGSFPTEAEATAWAEEHLGKTEWSIREIADLAPRQCGCGGKCMLCDDDGLIYTEVKVLPNFRMAGEAPDEWTGMVGRVLRAHDGAVKTCGTEVLVELGHHEVWIRRTRLQTQAEEVNASTPRAP